MCLFQSLFFYQCTSCRASVALINFNQLSVHASLCTLHLPLSISFFPSSSLSIACTFLSLTKWFFFAATLCKLTPRTHCSIYWLINYRLLYLSIIDLLQRLQTICSHCVPGTRNCQLHLAFIILRSNAARRQWENETKITEKETKQRSNT